jgi:hemin uptake protein HemP
VLDKAVANQTSSKVGAVPEVTGKSVVTSKKLFDGDREIIILHSGQKYHLRITRQDKLILTK